MPIGFTNCCCNECDCERSWPGKGASLHAVWNVNKPIVGTESWKYPYIERSSSSHFYNDYQFIEDKNVPYWFSQDPLYQPRKPFFNAHDFLVKHRIRFTHPDLPAWTHNIACTPEKKLYENGPAQPFIGKTKGDLIPWTTNYLFNYNEILNAEFEGFLHAIKDRNLKCFSFSGEPKYETPLNQNYFHYVNYLPFDFSGIRTWTIYTPQPPGPIKRYVLTHCAFVFTNEMLPCKHFHYEGSNNDSRWPSDQCNENSPSDWTNRWSFCGPICQFDLSHKRSRLVSYNAATFANVYPQYQAMSGHNNFGNNNGYTPFGFIPKVGSTPIPSQLLAVTGPETHRTWSLYLSFELGQVLFFYEELAWFGGTTVYGDPVTHSVIRVQPENFGLFGNFDSFEERKKCYDGQTWNVVMNLYKFPMLPPWLGWGGPPTQHTCEVKKSWPSY